MFSPFCFELTVKGIHLPDINRRCFNRNRRIILKLVTRQVNKPAISLLPGVAASAFPCAIIILAINSNTVDIELVIQIMGEQVSRIITTVMGKLFILSGLKRCGTISPATFAFSIALRNRVASSNSSSLAMLVFLIYSFQDHTLSVVHPLISSHQVSITPQFWIPRCAFM